MSIPGNKIETQKLPDGSLLEIENLGQGKSLRAKYRVDGTPLFVGEYVDGQANGRGTEFRPDGSKKFEGECVDGQANGRGTVFRPDGSKKFEGEYVDDRRHGHGVEVALDGTLTEQKYDSGQRVLCPESELLSNTFREKTRLIQGMSDASKGLNPTGWGSDVTSKILLFSEQGNALSLRQARQAHNRPDVDAALQASEQNQRRTFHVR